MVDAAHGDLALVDELMPQVRPEPTVPLGDLEAAGLARLLRVGVTVRDRAAVVRAVAAHRGAFTRAGGFLREVASLDDAAVAGLLRGRAPRAAAATSGAAVMQARRELLAQRGVTVSTHVAYAAIEVPPGPAAWTVMEDPAAWLADRAALHVRLGARALADARQFADAVADRAPFLAAMRGNTAVGKTRAIEGSVPELASVMADVKGRHRASNPDNFKIDLIEADLGLLSQQVHVESSVLAKRHKQAVLAMKLPDGRPASLLVDQRLLTLKDVQEYAASAARSGRKFVLYDVDASLELSLVGVLLRQKVEDGPIPPYATIARGFQDAHNNRRGIQDWMSVPGRGDYYLFTTKPDGSKELAWSVVGGRKKVVNSEARDAAETEVTDAALGRYELQVIDEALVDRLTAPLTPAFAAVVRDRLRDPAFFGRTWVEAVTSHGKKRSGR